MADRNDKMGFKPVHSAGEVEYRVRHFLLDEATKTGGSASNLFVGDLVKLATDTTKVMKAATPGSDEIVGVVVSIRSLEGDGTQAYTAALPYYTSGTYLNQKVEIEVITNPYLDFYCTVTGTATLATTMFGKTFDWKNGTGSTLTKKSGLTLDLDTEDPSNQVFRLMGLYPRGDQASLSVTNDTATNRLQVIVRFNDQHVSLPA